MSCCATEDNQRRHSDIKRCQSKLRPKSKLPAEARPLGVLMIHGPVGSDRSARQQNMAARGGLAGWQRKRVFEFIENHLAETISISALAALVQLSPYHFARAFKQTFGLPPHRYHMSRRVERAKVLLADRSVTEVAIAVGYAETSSFSASFRRTTGVSPSEFRRAL